MTAVATERPAAVAQDLGPGDFRGSIVTKINEITDKYSDFVMGAGGMAPHAWDLLDVAVQLGYDILEKNIPRIQDDAGRLKMNVKKFRAALHGVLQLVQAGGESCWRTTDDIEVLAALRVDTPTLDAMVDALERQRHWEVDLGNKLAVDQPDEARPAPTEVLHEDAQADKIEPAKVQLDPNPLHLLGQATAVLQAAVDQNPAAPAVHALINLSELCEDRAASAHKDGNWFPFLQAGVAISSILELMNVLSAEQNGGPLFYAAQSLLALAKDELEEQLNAVGLTGAEAAHA